MTRFAANATDIQLNRDYQAHVCVRGWYIAMVQYSSLCEGAVVNFLDAGDIGEEVLVRVSTGVCSVTLEIHGLNLPG